MFTFNLAQVNFHLYIVDIIFYIIELGWYVKYTLCRCSFASRQLCRKQLNFINANIPVAIGLAIQKLHETSV